ncbi:hypothetical protein E4U61_003501 [Claviceps capensis]|nr:hypothetical protein E4U61_003501 [Claviceps capensis]
MHLEQIVKLTRSELLSTKPLCLDKHFLCSGVQCNDGEIEQIGACTDDGYKFSGIIRTSVRTTKSLALKMISPEM